MNWSFYLFILVILSEYLGLSYRFPIITALKLPILSSLAILISVFSKDRLPEILRAAQFKIYIILIVWTFASIFFALVSMRAYQVFVAQIGYIILFLNACYMFLDWERAKKFLYVMLAIHVFLVLSNVEFLLANNRRGALKAGYFLGDGNDFGWSLATFLPLSIFCFREAKYRVGRLFSLVFGMLMLFGIALTGSRGASLATIASLSFLALQGKGKVIKVGALSLLVILVLLFAPNDYSSRVESIGGYQQDHSAIRRIAAWKAATQMAVDYPLGVGAGNFSGVYGRYYISRFATELTYNQNRWVAVHSIYFLMLAEYGFIGLALLLFLVASNFLTNMRTRALSVKIPEAYGTSLYSFSCYLNACLIAFCVGGVFLGGINYPTIYLLSALILATNVSTKRKLSLRNTVQESTPEPIPLQNTFRI